MTLNRQFELHRYHRYFVKLKEATTRKEVRSFTYLTLSLFTIAFFGFFAIRPTLVIIASLTKEIKEKEAIEKKFQDKIASLIKAQEEYSTHQEKFSLIDQALPSSPEFPSLILPLEKEALNSSVQVQSFSIAKIEIFKREKVKAESNQALSFEFTLALSGDYQNLVNFLKNFDRLRRSVLIDKFSFGLTKKTGGETQEIILTLLGKSNFYPSLIINQL